jgi:hypothetical protein
MKDYTAAPPETLRCDEKNLREYPIVNVCGIIYTTNSETEGIYLPADDRRHYVALSLLKKEDFSKTYWRDLYRWFDEAGDRHVAAYLMVLDLSGFDAKAPPPQTAAFLDIVSSCRPAEDLELADVLDKLGNPVAVSIAMVIEKAEASFADWLRDRRNSRQLPHRLRDCGYGLVRNPEAADGFWKVDKVRQRIYGRLDATPGERLNEARKLAGLTRK